MYALLFACTNPLHSKHFYKVTQRFALQGTLGIVYFKTTVCKAGTVGRIAIYLVHCLLAGCNSAAILEVCRECGI